MWTSTRRGEQSVVSSTHSVPHLNRLKLMKVPTLLLGRLSLKSFISLLFSGLKPGLFGASRVSAGVFRSPPIILIRFLFFSLENTAHLRFPAVCPPSGELSGHVQLIYSTCFLCRRPSPAVDQLIAMSRKYTHEISCFRRFVAVQAWVDCTNSICNSVHRRDRHYLFYL